VQPGLFLVAVFAVVKIVLGGQSAFVRTAGVLSGTTAVLQALLQAVPVPYYVAPATMPWLFAANVLACGLIAIGARVQERQIRAGPRPAAAGGARPYSLLPYGAMAAVWLLAGVVLAVHGLDRRAWVVLVGALVTTALVVARQVAAFRHIAELLRERDELTPSPRGPPRSSSSTWTTSSPSTTRTGTPRATGCSSRWAGGCGAAYAPTTRSPASVATSSPS
jgi:hypothetical protein